MRNLFEMSDEALLSLEQLFSVRINLHIAEMDGLEMNLADVRQEMARRKSAPEQEQGGEG